MAFYIAEDFFINGNIEGTSQEIEIMLDGLEESFREVGRENSTQYFLKVKSKNISKMISFIENVEFLKDMKELDPDRRDLYQSYLDTMSE